MAKTIFQIVFFVGFPLLGIVNSMQEEFTIWRSNRSPTDLFKMPDSVCKAANWTDYCGKVHKSTAAKRTPCSCLCGYRKSFLYKDGKWECVPDKIMMKREDCGFSLDKNRVPLLDAVRIRSLEVPGVQPQSCLVDEQNSKYLDCNSKWQPMNAPSSRSQFKMIFVETLRTKAKYELHVNATPGVPDVRGRIVKLIFGCKPQTGNSCLLFKIKGEVNCSVDPSKPLTTEKPTQQTTETPSATKITETPSATKTEEYRPPGSSVSTDYNVTNPNQDANRGRDGSSNVGLVAGVVAGSTVLLIILVCVAVVCIRQRKQRILRKNFYKVDRPPTPPLNNADHGEKVPLEKMNFRYIPAQPNPIYEGIPDEKLEKSNVQEPQYMNLNFRGGIKLGIHGPPPRKPVRNSLKRESNKAKASRNVNNPFYKSDSQTISVDPNIATPTPENQAEQQEKKVKDETRININEETHNADFTDGDDDEWDSFSEGDFDDEKKALQQQKQQEEVVYATIGDVGRNSLLGEVIASVKHLDKK